MVIDAHLDSRHQRPLPVGLRALIAGASLPPLTLGVLLVWARVAANAIHLCGWPARIACDSGTPLWWLLPATVTLVALSGVTVLVLWVATGRTRYSTGFAHVAWAVSLVPLTYVTRPRTFGWSDLIIGGAWIGMGIILFVAAAVIIFPSHRLFVRRGAAALGITYVVLLAVVPTILAEVAQG